MFFKKKNPYNDNVDYRAEKVEVAEEPEDIIIQFTPTSIYIYICTGGPVYTFSDIELEDSKGRGFMISGTMIQYEIKERKDIDDIVERLQLKESGLPLIFIECKLL